MMFYEFSKGKIQGIPQSGVGVSVSVSVKVGVGVRVSVSVKVGVRVSVKVGVKKQRAGSMGRRTLCIE
jgi:hypothetical protein